MDKLSISTPHHSALTKDAKRKFTKFVGTKGVGITGKVIISMDPLTGIVLMDRPNGLTLKFNPSKIFHGSNFKQINLPQLIEVINSLNDYLQPTINLRGWNVSGFDWCENIIVNHPPEKYLNLLDGLKKYERESCKQTGKTYSTKSNTKAVTFYNKLEEMKSRKEAIEPSEADANILRIEVGINKAPSTNKHLKNMQTLNDYLQPENYEKLPQVWLYMFNQIDANEHFPHIPNLNEREETLILFLDKYGWEGYRIKLKLDYKHNKKTLQRRLRELKQLQQKMITNTPQSLIKELQEKVEQVAQQRKDETWIK